MAIFALINRSSDLILSIHSDAEYAEEALGAHYREQRNNRTAIRAGVARYEGSGDPQENDWIKIGDWDFNY